MPSARRRNAIALGVLLLLSGMFAYVTGWRHHPASMPVDSSQARAQQHAGPATPPVPPGKPAHTDSVTAEPSGRLVDAYLFFFAMLSSHRARGAMNGSGGLGRDPHHTTTTAPHAEP